MNLKRVEEIVNSKGVIGVTYKDSPVWIESVVRDNATAQVKILSNNQVINIPVEDLNEES